MTDDDDDDDDDDDEKEEEEENAAVGRCTVLEWISNQSKRELTTFQKKKQNRKKFRRKLKRA